MSGEEYTAKSIDILEDIEGIRLRPGMYIHGISESEGIHQLVDEILDNAVDEHLAGYCDKISISLNPQKQIVKIVDNGRGIPGSIHEKTGTSTLEAIFTTSHAGGKFGKQAYVFSGGLHGVGSTVVNALSERLSVVSYRGDHAWKQSFQRGIPTAPTERVELDTPRRGTAVQFVPDLELFDDLRLDPDVLAKRLSEIAYICPGLHIQYAVAGRASVTYHNADGLKGLLDKHIEDSNIRTMHDIVEIRTDTAEIAFVWTNADDEHWYSYVNVTELPEGGTQVSGMRRAIAAVLGRMAKEKLNGQDLRDGLIVATHFKVSDPMFQGQTKNKILNKALGTYAYDILVPELRKLFADNPELATGILTRAQRLKKERANLKRVKDSLKSVAVRKRCIMPDKLAGAYDCTPEERELFIVEGESAGGSAKAGRDTYYQEVLPLRGKIANAARTGDGLLLKNKEIQALIACIGAGIDHAAYAGCNPEMSRVGKVLLLMDADPDGAHIATLVLAFIVMYMRPMIDAGKVYVVISPLYIGQYRGKVIYGDSHEEVLAAFPNGAKVNICRMKGHGEANAEEIRRYAMAPKHRKLWRLQLTDKSSARVELVMGENAATRKRILGIK